MVLWTWKQRLVSLFESFMPLRNSRYGLSNSVIACSVVIRLYLSLLIFNKLVDSQYMLRVELRALSSRPDSTHLRMYMSGCSAIPHGTKGAIMPKDFPIELITHEQLGRLVRDRIFCLEVTQTDKYTFRLLVDHQFLGESRGSFEGGLSEATRMARKWKRGVVYLREALRLQWLIPEMRLSWKSPRAMDRAWRMISQRQQEQAKACLKTAAGTIDVCIEALKTDKLWPSSTAQLFSVGEDTSVLAVHLLKDGRIVFECESEIYYEWKLLLPALEAVREHVRREKWQRGHLPIVRSLI